MSTIATIVIPIRAKQRFSQGIRRLRKLLNSLPNSFEVIVVDDGSPTKVAAYVKYLSEKYEHVRYVYISSRLKKFSLSRARNQGAKSAKSDVVIFHDVDFLGSHEMYMKIAQEIQLRELGIHPENFFCVPVAFLSDVGTELYLDDFNKGIHSREWSFLEHSDGPSENVNFIVKGSSCIVCNKKLLLSIGGHDERYKGHGAEDFELLHRLGNMFPIAELPIDYSTNTKSGAIQAYRGFRAYFALYGQECRNKGIVLVHLYHPKRAEKRYYQHKKNFKMLKILMEKDGH